MKNTKAQLSAFDEIIVDGFAGGGLGGQHSG